MRILHGTLVMALLLGGWGCARVTHEGGERPIHIVHDVNIRVDRQLDEFFAFQERYRSEMEMANDAAPAAADEAPLPADPDQPSGP